ncbi:hypothetical protein [Rhizobium sp. BK376]|uniref:hypothetical protein n=1 Tax=Rhizobium sp. BK376 TaxID=2512149 RepID=UPI00104CAE45|nr:hypothetical protein [Rhizobium sp. BK376]TCR91238.1 hypothetical protein EV561_103636 [Rhizobium sp. BK376]
MRHLFFLAAAMIIGIEPTYAANRYNCAVDDTNIKLNIDAGFAEDGGHKLNHFRGALVTKSDRVPEGFRRLMLDSDQLMQSWASDSELRLRIYAQNDVDDPANNFDLLLTVDGSANPMRGNYLLTFNAKGQSQPAQFKGRLTCSEQ